MRPLRLLMMGSEESWEREGLGHRPPMLARAFARSSRVEMVYVVNHPISIPSRLRKGFSIKRTEITPLESKLSMVNSASWIPERDAFLSGWDRKQLARHLREKLLKTDFEADILWVGDPRIADMASFFQAKLKIFDAMDNLLVHPQFKKILGKIKKGYEWASKEADFIVVASEAQRQMFPKNKNILLVSNGVAPEFLKEVKGEVPEDLVPIKRPVILYVGALQERLDVDLMKETAALLPRHQFVFAGPILNPGYFKSLRMAPNVNFIGAKAYSKIPDYIHHADVCIVPHRINEFTASMNPMKIFEYLACGKPIVSTRVAGTEEFKKYIYLADDAPAFARAIERAIRENNADLESERNRQAALHSWDIRVESLWKMLESNLQRFFS